MSPRPAHRDRTVRRLVALVAIAALGVVPAAANNSTVTWTTPSDGSTLAGARDVEFRIDANSGVQHGRILRWSVKVLESGDPQVDRGVLCSAQYQGSLPESVTVRFSWDTRFVPGASEQTGSTSCDSFATRVPSASGTLSANATHVLQVRVTTRDVVSDETVLRTRTVVLDNPPAAPSGASSSFDAGDQVVTVGWNANGEPGLLGYVVHECRKTVVSQTCQASDWREVATEDAAADSTIVPVSSAGVYRYRVAALRTAANPADPAHRSSWSGAGDPIVLEAATEADPGPDGDDEEEEARSPTTGRRGSTRAPGAGSDAPGGEGLLEDGGGGAEGPGVGNERSSDLRPRLVQRTEYDGGYDETLPYGARPVTETPSRVRGALASGSGAGDVTVPIAGGLVLFVFAMQMRYLTRRAGSLATVAAARSEAVGALAAFRDRLTAGNVIATWKSRLTAARPRGSWFGRSRPARSRPTRSRRPGSRPTRSPSRRPPAGRHRRRARR